MIVPRQLHPGHKFEHGRSVIPRPSLPPGEQGRFYDGFATRARNMFAGQTSPPTAQISAQVADPIENLPHELSIQCIHEALLSSGSYTARLLELTTVCRKWLRFLTSESLLWTEIHIKWTEPDLLACIAASLQLSGERSLSLTIWGLPRLEWENTRRLLLPHHRRINYLDFRAMGSIPSEEAHRTSDRCFRVASALVRSLANLPNLRTITYGRELEVNPPGIDEVYIPQGGRVVSGLKLSLPTYTHRKGDLDMGQIVDFDPTLLSLPSSITLDLDISGGGGYIATDCVMSVGTMDFSQLECVLAVQPEHIDLKRVIHFSASQLVSLSFKFGSLGVTTEILNLLPRLRQLSELTLHMTLSGGFNLADLTPHVDSTPGLRKLTLTFRPWNMALHVAIENALLPLMAAFASRHPFISSLSFNLFEGMIQPMEYYIVQWEFLETLSFITWHWAVVDNYLPLTEPPVALSTVTDLTVDDIACIQELELPNLLLLRVNGGITNSEEIGFRFRHLRKLYIHTYLPVTFDSLAYPELRELNVVFYQASDKLDISSLLQLESITITSQALMNDQGNLLCMALLYHPGHCPVLQELHFNNFVEWDILYLMLERRNVGLDDVKKIRKVTLPFIPRHLRQSLALLLEGTLTERPNNLELSLEETREALVDPTIDGCFYCVKNMRLHCSEATSTGSSGLYNDVLPNFQDPPSTVPAEICDWMAQRQSLEEKWIESHKEFQRGYLRRKSCSRYEIGQTT